ncbi:hypothetical protein HOY80DRAFT_865824, partial [Tuber brumale]
DTDILVTRGPPVGHLSGDMYGCGGSRKALRRVCPMFHVFGYVHASYGTTTLRFDGVRKLF